MSNVPVRHPITLSTVITTFRTPRGLIFTTVLNYEITHYLRYLIEQEKTSYHKTTPLGLEKNEAEEVRKPPHRYSTKQKGNGKIILEGDIKYEQRISKEGR